MPGFGTQVCALDAFCGEHEATELHGYEAGDDGSSGGHDAG